MVPPQIAPCAGCDVSAAVRVRFFFSSRRRHTRFDCDWSSDVCSSDLLRSSGAPELHKEPLLSFGLLRGAQKNTGWATMRVAPTNSNVIYLRYVNVGRQARLRAAVVPIGFETVSSVGACPGSTCSLS